MFAKRIPGLVMSLILFYFCFFPFLPLYSSKNRRQDGIVHKEPFLHTNLTRSFVIGVHVRITKEIDIPSQVFACCVPFISNVTLLLLLHLCTLFFCLLLPPIHMWDISLRNSLQPFESCPRLSALEYFALQTGGHRRKSYCRVDNTIREKRKDV